MISWNKTGDGGTAFASDLGWAPGSWPETFDAAAKTGEQASFKRGAGVRDPEGDLTGFSYSTDGNVQLFVFND